MDVAGGEGAPEEAGEGAYMRSYLSEDVVDCRAFWATRETCVIDLESRQSRIRWGPP